MRLIERALFARQAKMLIIVLATICAIAIFTKMIFAYLDKFEKALEDESSNYLSEIAINIAINMQTVVENTTKALETFGYAILSAPNEAERMDYLNEIRKKYDFAYLGYAFPDGNLVATMKSESKNISNEEYFQNALLGKSGVQYVPVKIFTDKAISGILFSVPIYDMNKSSSEPVGALIAMLNISSLNKVMSVESFKGEGYTYIIDMKGEIILRTKSMDYSNLYMLFKRTKFLSDYTVERMADDISNHKEGFAIYSDFGVEKYIYYKYIGIDYWSIVTIVEKNVITAKTTQLTKELTIISVSIMISFAILLVFALSAYRASSSRKQAADAKTAFLANMSHEIRTPMNAIVGISEVLLREKLSAKQKDFVLSIINAGSGLLTIINDILDISKIESGKFNIIDEEYELESLIYDITTIIAIKIGDKPLEFLIDIDTNLPKYLIGDMVRVKQILLNIIGNAAKFTNKGYIKFKINSQVVGDGEIELTMIVEDTGIGIQKKDLNKLFVSFNQVDTHKNRSIEGTGLGLVISKRLSEMMGGGISIESDYGIGSTFTIKIKQKVARPEKLVDISTTEHFRLLILEESEILREYFTTCLNKMNVEYDECEDWETFVGKMELGGYSHIIASLKTMQRLERESKQKCNAHFITLLKLDEQSLFENYRLNVYIPLFTIQMVAALYDRVGNAHLMKRGGLDILSIQPMPFVRVLVVDDNKVNLQVANGLMNPYHMQVDCALSGAKAIEMIQEKDYDLVFMDHMMPEMDGVEAVRIIRSLPESRHRNVTVVALTANVTNDAKKLFVESGFNDFLAKPIEIVKLNTVLKRWLKSKNDSAEETQKMIIGSEELETYVDFEAGVEKLGSVKVYCSILSTYCSSMEEKMKIIPIMLENDMKNFIVEVHGIKGASAGILADYAAEQATELEILGKANKVDKMKELLPNFISAIEKTLAAIGSYLEKYVEEDEDIVIASNNNSIVDKRKHIVIVDDDHINLFLAENVLSKDYRVSKFSSGELLLEFLTHTKPDMVLLDVQMPNMTGYEVLKKMNENSETKNIPVIFLTGETGNESEREGFRLGAKDFIKKPFDKEVMLARISAQLDLNMYRSRV